MSITKMPQALPAESPQRLTIDHIIFQDHDFNQSKDSKETVE